MLDQAPVHGGFEFGAGFLVEGHGRFLTSGPALKIVRPPRPCHAFAPVFRELDAIDPADAVGHSARPFHAGNLRSRK
jgi:hypothetical protein